MSQLRPLAIPALVLAVSSISSLGVSAVLAQSGPPVGTNMVVPGAHLGDFGHGTKVHACYDGGTLVDIRLRTAPFTRACTKTTNLVHAGVDLLASKGAPIHSIADGVVSDVVRETTDPAWRSLGFAVIVRHDSRLKDKDTYSLYLHLAAASPLAVGARVVAGRTVLGGVGDTGAAFGSHLHLEVRHFAGRFFAKWANIYGVEAGTTQGRTFLEQEFADNWQDPLQSLTSANSAPPAAGPDVKVAGRVVQAFYTACLENRRSEAESLLSTGARVQFRAASGALERFCSASTKNNTLTNVQVISQELVADQAVVVARLAFRGGIAVDRDTSFLVHEGGAWRITFGMQAAGMTFAQRLTAAQAGDSLQQLIVGSRYATGTGVRASGPEAVRWLEQAAQSSGSVAAAAAGWLGAVYRDGMGLAKNGELALKWFQRGVDLGGGASAQNLAEMYSDGKLVKKNATLSDSWYARAAALYEKEFAGGDEVAAYRLGRLYALGLGVSQDRNKAVALLTPAANAGNADASRLLADVRSQLQTGGAGRASAQASSVGTLSRRDGVSGGIVRLAQRCPTSLDAFAMASMEGTYQIRVELPNAAFLLDNAAVAALLDRAVDLAAKSCPQELTITKAEILVFAPGFTSDSAPAAKGAYAGGLLQAVRSGRSRNTIYTNYVLARANWDRLNQLTKVDTTMTVEALSANPFAVQGKTVAVFVGFESMETATIALFSAPLSDDERDVVAVTRLKVPRIAVQGLPTSQFTRAGQRAVLVGVVVGRAERSVNEDRIPLLAFRAMHLCTDDACSDMVTLRDQRRD